MFVLSGFASISVFRNWVLLLLVDLLKCLLLFQFLGIGFAFVSVFRNWVCFCFWVFVIFLKCFLIYDHVLDLGHS